MLLAFPLTCLQASLYSTWSCYWLALASAFASILPNLPIVLFVRWGVSGRVRDLSSGCRRSCLRARRFHWFFPYSPSQQSLSPVVTCALPVWVEAMTSTCSRVNPGCFSCVMVHEVLSSLACGSLLPACWQLVNVGCFLMAYVLLFSSY